MFALARGTGASRPCRGLRACAYEALATDALAAPQLGRKGRPQKADGLLALWSDTQPEVRDAHAYQVDEVLHWDDEVPTRLVAFYFVRRRPDLSLDAFRARYSVEIEILDSEGGTTRYALSMAAATALATEAQHAAAAAGMPWSRTPIQTMQPAEKLTQLLRLSQNKQLRRRVTEEEEEA